MSFSRKLLCWIIRLGTNIICRIDYDAFDQIPRKGPIILAANHISSLEVPLLYAHLQPRRLFGLAKIETWDNKFMGWVFNTFEAIPVRRGEADLFAIRRSLHVLKEGHIIVVAPEGTRSRHGRLLRAQPGIVTLALHSGAPILPMVHWGSESFMEKLRHFQRIDFHVRVGKPFIVKTNGKKLSSELRQKIVDEIMYQIAILLPEEYRGDYSNPGQLSETHLEFV